MTSQQKRDNGYEWKAGDGRGPRGLVGAVVNPLRRVVGTGPQTPHHPTYRGQQRDEQGPGPADTPSWVLAAIWCHPCASDASRHMLGAGWEPWER